MGILLLLKSAEIADDTTHIVVCDKCCEIVARHRKGGSIRVTLSAAIRHEDLSLFGGHYFKTYNRKTKRMANGVILEGDGDQ